ncbi:MAG: F0F1 ATP synthase subunit A [Bacteroidales bacterium]|nr:F0F1 ATP synthase subunit A [Bacteroidales bacterium]
MIYKKINLKLIYFIGILSICSIFNFNVTIASNTNSHNDLKYDEEIITDEEFNAGKIIVEHIIDAHEWHIADIGHTHISIPLPVILLYNGKLDVFCSSKFHHRHSSYKGYKIETEGENKGKIVRVIGESMETDKKAKLPLDLSITKNVLALFISMFLICWIFISIARTYKKRKGMAPKGLQSFLEPLILFIRDDVAIPSIGEKKYERYMPFLLTLFFFILFNNLLGLVPFFPGGANITGNLAITGVLALFTFIIITFSGNKNYWVHIFNTPGVPWWMKIPVPLMPIVEIMGVFTKPFVLMIRLFANITAGHIITLGFISLIFIFGEVHVGLGLGVSVVSVAFGIFMTILELLVAFIQAYVFTLLSALYFGMATEEHH